ncbi:hypothetical protein [Arthrobacter sp. STN4]|uniref:hypothetical protein n=1 Tax=Arthrobacter sp. STN4 TaxID=2923276 RepID=UPI00211A52FE|nr:hypothetical protein [Arthrobacter sp. STN4]MCQ9162975.1 hypothetical protein [Arthrobacter sp. STN4]
MARQRQVAGAVHNGGLGRSAPENFSTGFPQSNFDYSQQIKGQSHRSNSLALGVIGLFFLGIILGPLAISQANKAESLGVPAAAGKVLGTIDLIGGALLLISFLVYSMG